MNFDPELSLERDHETYKVDFDNLPFERILEKYRMRRCLELLKNIKVGSTGSILEIGPGYNPIAIKSHPNSQISFVEPSSEIFQSLISEFEQFPNVKIFKQDLYSYVSDQIEKRHELVILSSVFHEIPDPKSTLEILLNLISQDGHLILVVPNNESTHRLFGVQMGVLENTTSLTQTEIQMQQHANYSKMSIESLINNGGFEVVHSVTSFVKPHTHRQMQSWYDEGKLSDANLEMLYDLSEFFEPYNSELFVVAKKK